ncbi:MAG: ubiquinone biosynthesis protein UbiB, partial [Rhizobiaceae bacterium]|nr:ubiquinone biosynthesis protein UbiB [Rhizobiaceae bacterium]
MVPFDPAIAKKLIEGSLGRELDDLFSEFSEPIAAASVAQVHKATRKSDGKVVAVKVIRPGVRNR